MHARVRHWRAMDTTERPSKYSLIGPAVVGLERGLIGWEQTFRVRPGSAKDAGRIVRYRAIVRRSLRRGPLQNQNDAGRPAVDRVSRRRGQFPALRAVIIQL